MRFNRRKYNSGYSMLEVIFATSIITASVYAGFAGLTYLNRYLAARKEYSRETNLVMTVLATVAANPAMFPPGDDLFGARDASSGDVLVPPGIQNPYYAYGPYYFGPATDCPECPNRIGVATRAMPGNPRSLMVDVVVLKLADPAKRAVAASGARNWVKMKTYTSAVSF